MFYSCDGEKQAEGHCAPFLESDFEVREDGTRSGTADGDMEPEKHV